MYATRRRWPRIVRWTAVPAASAVVVALGVATPAAATGTPSQQAASTVVKGLLDLGHAIGAVSAQPALSTKLPLTDISVRSVLDLDTAVGRHVTSAVTGANADLDTLAGIVSADSALDMTAVGSPSGAPAGSRDWLFSVDLQATTPIPLAYDDDRLQFGAAQLTGEAAGRLTATFRVRYDPNALVLRQFSVVGDTTLTTHVWSRPTGGAQTGGQQLTAATFPAVDGFVQLDAGGTGTIDTTTVLRLRDPNGRGALTTEDFEFSSADEMFTTTTPPGADDVHMNVGLSTALLSSGSHGSVVVGTRTSATDPYATPVVTRDTALTALTALTRPQALNAFTQYASAMVGVEGSVDAALPLLSVNLSDLYAPGRKLMSVMSEQAIATITCGAADTSPPSGAPRPGQMRYCQATTDGLAVDDNTSVTWSSPDAGVTFSGSSANTVGTAPTANIHVTGGGGFPRLRVSFVSDGTTYTARSLVVSIQQLAASVSDLGLGGVLSYNGTNRSLEITVRQNQAASETKSVSTGGNGNLAPLTGLTGLCQADTSVTPRVCPQTGDAPTASTTAPATGSANVTTSGRQIAADFGIGLVPAAPAPVDGEPAPPSPVAYVKPGASGLLWQVASVTAAMTANSPMVARIGFLQVDVDVTSYTLATNANTAAARVTTPTGTVTIDGGTVSGAVTVDALGGTTPGTTATRGLTATAHLAVADSPMGDLAHTRPINKSGTVDATWTDLRPDHLPTVTTGGDYDDLRALDIVPARQGVMDAGTDATTHTLHDGTADFLAQFGLSASDTDKTVTRKLYDLDATYNDWTVCTTFTVVDAHSLTCTEGSLADAADADHPGAGFAVGHHYVTNGDPTALRDVLIDDLAAVLSVYSSPDESLGAGKTLPLVDLLPSDVDAARTDLGKVLVGLQNDSTTDTPVTDVSTLQAFTGAVGHYAPTAVTSLSLDTTNGRLDLELSKSAPASRVDAPLRITAGDSELRLISGVDSNGDPARVKVPLNASSSADVHLAVDLATAASYVGNDTSVAETVTGWATPLSDVKDSLAGLDAEYGATTADVGHANDIDLGLGVHVATTPADGSATWIPIADFRGSLAQTRSVQGDAQTCGGADSTADPDLIAACAEIPLTEAGNGNSPLTTVNVALRADESSGGTGADLANQPLAYQFLADGLAGLSRTLKDSLDGDLANLSMPLVGTDLDGGADIPAAVQGYVAAARTALTDMTQSNGDPIDDSMSAADFATALAGALNGVTVTGITADETTVTVTCSGDPCDSGDTLHDVTEVRAPLSISGHKTGEKSTFRPGLAGVALDTDLEVPTDTTWTVTVELGIQRGTGPFLVMNPASGSTTYDVLTEHVTSHLPDYAATNCHAWDREDEWETKRNSDAGTTHAANFWVKPSQDASAQCLNAFVGKLPSVLVDRKDDTAAGNGTELIADVTVAVTPADVADSDGRVFLPKLFDKKLPWATTAAGTGGLALYFESYASDFGFFDVLGTIDLDWADGVFDADGLKFGSLLIDANTVYDAVGVGFGKAKKWLAPLNPVVDVLTAPIPGISQLAQMIGEPPISLLSILAKADPRAGIIINLLQFYSLVANLPGSSDTPELVDLGSGVPGSFHLPTQMVQFNSCSKTVDMTKQGGLAFTAKSSGTGASGRCDEKALSRIKRKLTGEKAPKDPTAGKHVNKQMTKSPYFTMPSITYPVFEDANQVYDLLLGDGDTTLLYVDLGHAGYKVTLQRNFGPLMIGPVPVVASIAVIVGFDARFAFGFDTRGLSQMEETLDPGDVGGLTAFSHAQVMADGFFIDDLEHGVDVPEIQLTVTVEAGASVSIGFAEAGIRGGVILDLSLDAFDPNGDGKIYSSEFAGASNGPDCAFNVSSGLTFYLQFWFRVDLFLYTIYKAYDIVRSPRIKLFEFNCTVQQPTLAVVQGSDLWLTMGDHVSSRHAFTSTTAEKYTVRQTGPTTASGTPVEVSAFNLVQSYTIPAGGKLKANGLAGNDTVKLLPGQNVTTVGGATTVTDIPFTAPAEVNGGDGDDVVTTGDGDDTVTGGNGNDTVNTGVGNDSADGNDGNDAIDTGPGKDVVTGGNGDDRLSGGPGADSIVGGAGDDVLDGGIGAQPQSLFTTTDTTKIAGLLDAGDLVVGNDGSDHVTGGDGSDLVVGGAYDTTGVTFTATQTTTVFGVSATNIITRLVVTTSTVTLPTLATVRTACADAGSTTDTGRDDVSGGPDRDYVLGGGGVDTLSGGAGDDVVCGRGGDDTLDGDGPDVTAVNQGADEVRGGPGNDQMYGAGGNDDMYGDAGNDMARGGNGDDTETGGAGSDLLLGEAGNDTIAGDDTTSTAASSTGTGRAITCATTVSVVGGRIDLNADLSGNSLDDGRLEGMGVSGGLVVDAGGTVYNGVLGGVVFVNGTADLDGNGAVDPYVNDANRGDTGAIELAGINGAVGDGDCLLGGAGTDTLDGQRGGDYVDGGDGDDPSLSGGTGDDLVRGGAGDDTAHGNAGDDLVAGDGGADILYGDAGDDVVRGSSGDDLLAGGTDTASATDGRDQLLGDGGDDVVVGGNATLSHTPIANTAIAGRGVTLLATATTSTTAVTASGIPAGVDDQLYGGFGADWVFAGSGDDQAYGGPDDDLVEGGPGADLVQGDDGADKLVGGSSTGGAVTTGRTGTGISDGDDTLVGDHGVDGLDGADVLAGDNARLDTGVTVFDGGGADTMSGDGGNDLIVGQGGDDTLHGNAGNDTLVGDDAAVPSLAAPVLHLGSATGADTITGDTGDDDVYAGPGNDTVHGNDGADALEGDGGADTMYGDAGDDLLTGGSSADDGVIDADRTGDGVVDGGDTLNGGDGSDIVAGDNARLVREAVGTARTSWPRIRPTANVVLSDVASGAGAADTIHGDAGDDLLFGQGGADTVSGDDGADAIEGGNGADGVHGNAGNDEIVGGAGTAGSPDTGDTLAGDDGDDTVAGDNAVVDSTATPVVTLLDVPAPGAVADAALSGNDTITGDAGDDTLFGQGGDDTVSGNDGKDAIEGDAGDDTLNGNAGNDELTGGSSSNTGGITTTRVATGQLDGADTLDGGDGDDVLAGDNARLIRTASTRADGTALRLVQLFDNVTSGTPVGGGDTLRGANGRDLLFGQGGDDTVSGGDGVDYAEGNAGNDTIAGDGGEDDLLGGSSAANGTVLSGTGSGDRLLTPIPKTTLVDSSAAGVLDGNDTIYGGSAPGPAAGTDADSADVVLGDNGRVTRSCTAGSCTTISGGGSGVHTVRQVAMADTAPGLSSGSDTLFGQDGDDELYGQFDNTDGSGAGTTYQGAPVSGDVLDGGAGDDALAGDQGVDVPTAAADLGKTNTTLSGNAGFVSELVRPAGTLVRVLTQTQPTVGGNDVLLGGTGFDSVHAGAGADVVNAGDGDDVVFAGDGNDAVWGGGAHDRLFGGTGDDQLDVKRNVDFPALWTLVAPVADTDGLKATVNGLDTAYGGSGHDALQGDMGDSGKTPGDRLMDWTGTYNLFLVCGGAYGAGKVLSKADPSTVTFLQNLAAATGSVGGAELALVGSGGEPSPGYPGAPGHFTCEAG